MIIKPILKFSIAPLLLWPSLMHAQKIDSMMNVYAENFPQEKVYVHFDKNIYNAGETIWYKAYLFADGFPSQISRNFYTELSDADGNILQRNTAPVSESTAAGNFDLPKKIKEGFLHFRAYSTWMKNFDTAFIFEKDIRVLSVKNSQTDFKTKEEYRLHFFPEGGDIIAGIENNIAFKADDQSGIPFSVKGIIKNREGKEVAKFGSEHDGMGNFLITPAKEDSLYAVWNDLNGSERTTELPAIKQEGVLLRVMNDNGKIFFYVGRPLESNSENKTITLAAYLNQHLVYKAKIDLMRTFMSSGSIPVENLPSGILQMTLFNSNQIPVAERVVFINNHEFEFHSEATLIEVNTTKRGENIIEISVPDALKANMSLSVTDALSDGIHGNSDNIISHLLLTGDIRGYVHNPSYYFSNTSDSLSHFLDLVMLTHGWRRYNWTEIAKGNQPSIKYTDQNYLSLNAEITGVPPEKIASNESMNVILQTKDSSKRFLSLPYSTKNKFGINGLIFFDTAMAYYSFNVNDKLSEKAIVNFGTGLLPGYSKINNHEIVGWNFTDSSLLKRNQFIIEETEHNTFSNQKIKTLKPVTVQGRVKSAIELLDEKYTSGAFIFSSHYAFDLTTDPFAKTYNNALDYIRAKVAGLVISYATDNGEPTITWHGFQVKLFLNQAEIDPQSLRFLPATNIAYIKAFEPGVESSIFGSVVKMHSIPPPPGPRSPKRVPTDSGFASATGGVIAVYLKNGADLNDFNAKILHSSSISGYSVVKEFYSPDYSAKKDLNSSEDTRTTLLWKPYILTDKDNRKMNIRFYNSDITKKIRIVLEGVNEIGKLTRIEKIIE